MKYYFPDTIDEDLNHHENVRNISILRIDQLLEPTKERQSQIDQLEDYFVEQLAPISFRMSGGTNLIIDNEKKFEKLCASFSEAGMQDARSLTMYDFRIRMEYFKEKAESLKSNINNNADQQI